jgi:uncharacterized protein (TIGR03083 family)
MELVETECATLISFLEGRPAQQWNAHSLCAGWRVRDVVSHLLMPYELTTPRFMAAMVVNRFDFDRVANTWVLRDHRSPAELVDGLRTHGRFRVPGAGTEGELTHLVVHGLDLSYPLGEPLAITAEAANRTLDQLFTPKARAVVKPERLEGLSFAATDTGWQRGDGPRAEGPAAALILAIAGRTAALRDLTGAGAAALRSRRPSVATTPGQ